MFAQKTFCAADGVTLAYRDYDGERRTGAPIVCVAGLTRNGRDFAAFAESVPNRRVLTVDLRGRGLSAHAPDPLTYRHSVYVEDLRALLDTAGLDRAVIAGASMGGSVAMLAAHALGERVEGLILNDVGPDNVGSDPARIAAFLQAPLTAANWDEAAEKVRIAQGQAFPAYTHADWIAAAGRLASQRADGTIRADYDPGLAAPYEQNQVETWDRWAMFEKIADRPMLLARGALSTILSAETALRMRRIAPHMVYAEAENVGHHPDLTEPGVAEAIAAFLA